MKPVVWDIHSICFLPSSLITLGLDKNADKAFPYLIYVQDLKGNSTFVGKKKKEKKNK